MKSRIIYLSGFMGSGKSTIGPILANTLGWEFYDLDCFIEQKEGKKVSEIFESKGEAYFRKLESENLALLSGNDKVVIALGGGTLTNQSNFDLVKKTGKIIYLKASREAIFNRLKFKRDRPLLANYGQETNDNQLLQKIDQLYKTRKPLYEKADLTVDTDNINVGKTVDKLAKIILREIEIEENRSKNKN